MPLLLEEVYLSLIFGAPALGTVLLVTLTVGRRLSPFFFSLSLSLYTNIIYMDGFRIQIESYYHWDEAFLKIDIFQR